MQNLINQQSEIESLQFIFDQQLRIISNNVSDEMIDGSSREEHDFSEPITTYQFEISFPPVAPTENGDDNLWNASERQSDELTDQLDILQMKFHMRDIGYRVCVSLNTNYPSLETPMALRVKNLVTNPIGNAELIDKTLSEETVHKDLKQLLKFKKLVNKRERQQMEQLLIDHAKELLTNADEEPMMFYLVNMLKDHVETMEIDENEIDELMDQYKKQQSVLSDEEDVTELVSQALAAQKKRSDTNIDSGGGQPLVHKEDNKPSFSGIYKYAFSDTLKKKRRQFISLTPYLVLNKFSSKVNQPIRSRRPMQMTCLSRNNFIIAYGGLDVRSLCFTGRVRFMKKDYSEAALIRQSGESPTIRVLATLTQLEDDASDAFMLVGGMSSTGMILNDIFVLQMMGASQTPGYLNDVSLDSTTASWTMIPAVTMGVCGHSACYYRKTRGVLVFGGLTSESKYSNELLSITRSGKCKVIETTNAPNPRAGHAMSKEIRECLFIYGGHDQKRVFNDMYMLCTKTFVWTSIISLGPAPQLTHCSSQLLISYPDECLIIHGGYDGKRWQDSIYQFDIAERRWKVCFTSGSAGNDRLSLPAFSALGATQDNIVVLEGEASNVYGTNYLNYRSVLEQWQREAVPKSITSPPTIIYQHNSHMGLKYQESTLRKLVLTRCMWFEQQNAADCDVILLFEASEEDSEENYTALYCHKMILQQSPKLARIIAKAEKSEINDDIVLQHGVLTQIRMSRQNGLESFGKREFTTVCSYLYSGQIVLDESTKSEDYLSKLKFLAKLLHLQCLQEILTGSVTMSTIITQNISVVSQKFCQSFLKPRTLSEEEYGRLMRDVEMEQAFKADDIDFMSLAMETPDQAVDSIDDSHHMKHGLVKLIARNNNPQSESDEYLCIVCHKGVIIHQSPYFSTVFASQFSESISGVARIDQLSIQALEALCNYMYTGLLPDIDTSLIVELYLVSHQFQMSELGPWLRYLIRQNIDVNIACAICDISESLNDDLMWKFCVTYIARHLETILDSSSKDQSEQYLQETFQHLSRRSRSEIHSNYYREQKMKRKEKKRVK